MIPFKSKLSKYKNILNKNKAFDALTNKEKRQEIAFDGLKLILLKKVSHSTNFIYWSTNLFEIEKKTSLEFQNKLLNDLPKCQVCQRGLAMLSQIRLSNSISSTDFFRYDGNQYNIKGFTLKDFHKMENEYENNLYKHPYQFKTNHKLANISCNIIKNGNFHMSDKIDYLKLWDIKL